MSEDRYAWPEWMPAPQQDSFSIQPEDRRQTSETEAGSIIRYQFDTDINVADCTLILNRIQAAWFEAFERDVMRQGTVWFDFPLWIGGDIVYETCRFKTRPKAGNLIGLHTTYTFSLYVSKRSDLMPECVTEFLYCYAPKDICFMRRALDEALRVLLGAVNGAGTMSLLAVLKKYMRAFVAVGRRFSESIEEINTSAKASEKALGQDLAPNLQTDASLQYVNERIGACLPSLIPTYGIYAAMEELL